MGQQPQMPPPGFDALTVEEKEAYVDALTSRIRPLEVPEWHREELAHRRAADAAEPMMREPWREAIAGLRKPAE